MPKDFNGDGLTDIAIADPGATVNGVARAGRVHVVFGGEKGSQTISQADEFVSGLPESGDRFGFALAAVDYDSDGCGDLVVAAPFESSGTLAESGFAQVLYGSPAGFGPNGQLSFSQDATGMPGGSEAGDRFSYSITAGKTRGGEPYLVFGVPGEDIDDSSGVSQPDAGAFNYVRGSSKLLVHQGKAGVAGGVEAGDQYGLSVAASGRYVAAGGAGEAVYDATYSGTVGIFTHDVGAGTVGAIDQTQPGDTGVPEPGDWAGRSLSMVDYIPAGGSAAEPKSLLAVGAPGEALNANSQLAAGRAVVVDVDGQLAETSLGHGNVGVEGQMEPADCFGWSVHLVNRTPGQPATWQNLLLAVGVPGEESVTGAVNEGGVQAFSMVGAPGDHDTWVQPALAGAGYASAEDGGLGRHLGGSATHLYVADPFGASPAVYAIPWANLTDGATNAVLVYAPGRNGPPTGGVGTFREAIV